MDFSSSLNLFQIRQLKLHTTPIARMIGAALNWNNLFEFKKYVHSCFAMYYPPNLVKHSCFINDFMDLLLRNICSSYFEEHECFRDIRHLDVIFNYANTKRTDIIKNIKTDAVDWNRFLCRCILEIVNESSIDHCGDDNTHDEEIIRRLQLLSECLTNENDALFPTYGILCKSLITNVMTTYNIGHKQPHLHGIHVLRLSESMLEPNKSKLIRTINKIAAACDSRSMGISECIDNNIESSLSLN